MLDKEWLNKISVDYSVYSQRVGPNYAVENFIEWLYQQYGIVQQKKTDEDRV